MLLALIVLAELLLSLYSKRSLNAFCEWLHLSEGSPLPGSSFIAGSLWGELVLTYSLSWQLDVLSLWQSGCSLWEHSSSYRGLLAPALANGVLSFSPLPKNTTSSAQVPQPPSPTLKRRHAYIVQQKACDWCRSKSVICFKGFDWCKHFYHNSLLAVYEGWSFESVRRHPPVLPFSVAAQSTVKMILWGWPHRACSSS